MSEYQDELFSIIGSVLKDEYGHEVGRIISFTTTPNSKIKELLVAHRNVFHFYPRERITINDDGDAVLLTEVKMKTNSLFRDIPLIWKKDKILENLMKEGKIPPETYKEFHEQFENEKRKLKDEAEKTIEEIEGLKKDCEERFKSLSSSKVHLEIEYAIGKIKDEIYDLSKKAIDEELKSLMKEMEDLENMKGWLSNLILAEDQKEPLELKTPETEEEKHAEPEEKIEETEKTEEETHQEVSDEPSLTVRIL